MKSGSESRHSRGKAVDLLLPGVPLLDLARQARTLGRVGVGYYPNSGFVHLDIRERHSVFWIDRSAPGRRSCFRRLLKKTARKYDRRWRKWRDEPKPRSSREKKTIGSESGKLKSQGHPQSEKFRSRSEKAEDDGKRSAGSPQALKGDAAGGEQTD